MSHARCVRNGVFTMLAATGESPRALTIAAYGRLRQAVRVAFKCAAVPAAKFGGCLVRGLQEPGDGVVGVIGGANRFVGQQEFFVFVAVVGGIWFDAVGGEAVRLGVCVGVERALLAPSGPKAAAAELARVPLSHHPVRAVRGASGMRGCGPPGKSGTGQVHSTPEELDGARFS